MPAAVDDPDRAVHDQNLTVARRHFSLDTLTRTPRVLLEAP